MRIMMSLAAYGFGTLGTEGCGGMQRRREKETLDITCMMAAFMDELERFGTMGDNSIASAIPSRGRGEVLDESVVGKEDKEVLSRCLGDKGIVASCVEDGVDNGIVTIDVACSSLTTWKEWIAIARSCRPRRLTNHAETKIHLRSYAMGIVVG
jgi:hypothetical protein